MYWSYTLLFITLYVLSAQLSKTHSMPHEGLEKRGWTLNSAGYLLGPYAHRTLTLRNRAVLGKRDSMEEKSILSAHQPSYRSLPDESYLYLLLEQIMNKQKKEDEIAKDWNNSMYNDNRRQ